MSRLTESNPLLSGKRPRSLGALTYASHSDDGLTDVSVGEDSCGLSRTRDVRTKPSISHRQSSADGFSRVRSICGLALVPSISVAELGFVAPTTKCRGCAFDGEATPRNLVATRNVVIHELPSFEWLSV